MEDAARRVAPPGRPGHAGSQGRDPEAQTCARLYEQARAAGIKPLDVMVELARLVVRFAKMTRNPVGAAEQVERSVLAD